MKNKKFGLKQLTIIIVLIIAMALIYFIPRLLIVKRYVDKYGIPKEYEDIGLAGVYEGESLYANARNIKILLPVSGGDIEGFYMPYTESEGVSTLYGNNYEVMIFREDVGFRYMYDPLPALGYDNAIEYMLDSFSVQYDDLNIFQPLSKFREAYASYNMKSSLLRIYGSKYCVLDGENGYVLFAALETAEESNTPWDDLTINVYDKNNNYNLEATIDISQSADDGMGLTEEDVRFIVLNMEIMDKGE